MEMNPNNPTTATAHDHWHAIVAVMMIKLGLTQVTITKADIDRVHALPETPTVLLHDAKDGLHIKLINQSEGAAILERERVGGWTT